jgi:hypothetical protein
MDQAFSESDLARRRASARRLGWWLCCAVVLIYLLGLFIKR